MESTSYKNNLEYLNGPVSWYEFLFKDDNGNQKIIHLFGDEHVVEGQCAPSLKCMKSSKDEKSTCYDFIYFLEELFDEVKSNGLYADLFVEIPYLIKTEEDLYENIKANNVISNIFKKFESCIKRDKKNCTYLPNVRIHFSDIRTILLPDDKVDPLVAILASVTGSGKKMRSIDPIQSFLDLLKYMIHDLLVGILSGLVEVNQIKINLNNKDQIIQPDINHPPFLLYPITYDELASRINMIKLLFLILRKFCDFIKIIVSSDNYVEDMKGFLETYSEIISSQSELFIPRDIEELNRISERLLRLKHPKTKYSVVGQQLNELRNDKIMVNGKNMASLIETYINDSCEESISKDDIIENIIFNFDEFMNEVFDQTEEGFVIQPKFDKRYQRIETSKDIKMFYSYLEKESKNLIQIYNRLANIYDETTTVLESRLLDAFLLSRLFRTFSSSKKPHPSSILSIIYSGDLHTKYQVEFFKRYLGLSPIESVETPRDRKDFQCLHSKKLGKILKPSNL